jgi:hypothetical protein
MKEFQVVIHCLSSCILLRNFNAFLIWFVQFYKERASLLGIVTVSCFFFGKLMGGLVNLFLEFLNRLDFGNIFEKLLEISM